MGNIKKIKYSILFIEDKKEIRLNYITYLRRYYENVYEASTGIEALEIYKDKKPDILIIDINLPILSGIELLKKIRKKDHATRAIMLTANSQKEILIQASELKLTKYLLKPISRSGLKEALEIAIDELNSFKIVANKILYLKNNYAWNYETNELIFENKLITITPIERKILQLLFSNINVLFSHDDIILHVWNSFGQDKEVALKSALQKIRKKLPKDTLINIYGEGFKIIS